MVGARAFGVFGERLRVFELMVLGGCLKVLFCGVGWGGSVGACSANIHVSAPVTYMGCFSSPSCGVQLVATNSCMVLFT